MIALTGLVHIWEVKDLSWKPTYASVELQDYACGDPSYSSTDCP